jgi:hypothetical protein
MASRQQGTGCGVMCSGRARPLLMLASSIMVTTSLVRYEARLVQKQDPYPSLGLSDDVTKAERIETDRIRNCTTSFLARKPPFRLPLCLLEVFLEKKERPYLEWKAWLRGAVWCCWRPIGMSMARNCHLWSPRVAEKSLFTESLPLLKSSPIHRETVS